jgi:hypothetical protein
MGKEGGQPNRKAKFVEKPKVSDELKTKNTEGKQWHDVKTADGVGIQGGFATRPVFAPVVRHKGEPFVKVSKQEQWLCHVAGGQAKGLAPLKRTTLLETLREKAYKNSEALAGSEEPMDAMVGFGLDDDDLMPALPVSSRKNATGDGVSAKPVSIVLPGIGDPIVCLDGPPQGRTGKALWVHANSVATVVRILGEQVANRGVEYSPPETTVRKPWWCQKDRCWVCRAKHPSGRLLRKKASVPEFDMEQSGARRPLSQGAFARLKESKLKEIEQWQEDVEAGLIDE